MQNVWSGCVRWSRSRSNLTVMIWNCRRNAASQEWNCFHADIRKVLQNFRLHCTGLSLSHTCFLTPCVFAEDVMEDGGFHHSLIGQSDTKWQPLISSETSELCDSVASSRTRHERKRAAGRRFRRFQKLPSTFQIKTFCRLNRVGFWIGLERGSWRRKKRRSSGAIMLTLFTFTLLARWCRTWDAINE